MKKLNDHLLFAAVIIMLLSAALAACAPANPGEPAASATEAVETPVELVVCGSSTSLGSWPFIYADQTGIFEKYGLQVNYQTVQGGSNALAALLAGDVQICQLAGAAAANAALVDSEPVIVAGLINRQPYSLVVTPDIAKPEDLRGKAVAVNDFGGATETVLRSMLEGVGLDPDTDVTIVTAGSEPERIAALQSGQVAGTVISIMALNEATEAGLQVLQAIDNLDIPYQHTAVVTTRTFLADNEATVKNYLSAMIEARAVMSQDLEKGSEVIADGLDMDSAEERNSIREIFALVVGDYLLRDPYPSPDGLAALLEEALQANPSGREITADDLVDLSIVKDLDAIGFIDGLYQ